jgi:hypothetical protein
MREWKRCSRWRADGVLERVGVFAGEPNEFADFARRPIGENRRVAALARSVDAGGQRRALLCDRRLAHPPVLAALAPLHEPEVFEFAELAADRRVVAPGAFGQFDHADGTEFADPDQQREQRAIQRNRRFPQQQLVALRAVHHADDVEQRAVKPAEFFLHMCILHIFH